MTAAVKIEGLVLRAGREPLLGPVDLELEPGAHVLLVGRSGCGKTTLLRAIAGLSPVDAGTIEIAGRLAQRGGACLIEPHQRGVGLVFQGGALWPHMTVAATLRSPSATMQNVLAPPAHESARAAPARSAVSLLRWNVPRARPSALPRSP